MKDWIFRNKWQICGVAAYVLICAAFFAFMSNATIACLFSIILGSILGSLYQLKDLFGEWKSSDKKSIIIYLVIFFYLIYSIYSITMKYSYQIIYGQLGIILCCILMVGISVAYKYMYLKNYGIEKVFLILGTISGLAYTLMIPLNTVPDEDYHFNSTYKVSSVMMGYDRLSDDHYSMRKCDYDYEMPNPNYDYWEMHDYLTTFTEPTGDTSIILNDTNRLFDSGSFAFMYVIPAIGFTIGRLLNFNTIWMAMLGRMCNFLFYLILGYQTLKRMPFNKELIMTILLLPMVSQQCASLSYDVLAISCSLFVIAQTFYLYDNRDNVSRKDIIFTVAMCLLLFFTKQKAYFPLAFFPLFYFLFKNELWRHRIVKVFKYAVVIGTVGFIAYVVAVKFVFHNAICVEPTKIITAAESELPGYTIQYCMNHPMAVVQMLIRTTSESLFGYLAMMIGSALGWVNISISKINLYLDIFFLLIFALKRKGETHEVSKEVKWTLFVMSFISYIGIHVALLLSYTPYGFLTVYGMQGRYFLPILLPILLIIFTETLVIDKKYDKLFQLLYYANMILSIIFVFTRF